MKVFLDTNILLDVLARRQPFYADSAAVWTLAEQGRIEGLVSVLSFTNIFYVVRKLADAKTARSAMVLLRDGLTPVGCDGRILAQAIDSDLKDFEDAMQYYSAVQAGADCVLSRNPDDFPRASDCPVLTPGEFLAAHEFD
ncbi:MAG: PIN domain-containing protein [Pirellulales bacterium]